MKAVIINDSPSIDGIKPPFSVGEHVNISSCPCGCKGYEVKEYPPATYGSFRFAPVSDIDETTFERNYNTQLI